MEHDQSYKLFFSSPHMVADLLRGFVPEDWVGDLDFTSLEKVRGGDAPQEVSDLIVAVPGDLERYRPQFRYLLLDEGRFSKSDLGAMRNVVAALFRLENSPDTEAVGRVLAVLKEWLAGPEHAELRRIFVIWLRFVFLPGRMPGVEFSHLNDLQEIHSMLAERVVEWTEQWKREGLEQGLKEGLQQGLQQGLKEGLQQGLQQGLERGRQEGEAVLLLRLLERRFGAVSEDHRSRIQEADDESILRWGERLLTAGSADEVFDR